MPFLLTREGSALMDPFILSKMENLLGECKK